MQSFASLLTLLSFFGDFFSTATGGFRLVALAAGGLAAEVPELLSPAAELLGPAAELAGAGSV